MLSLVVARDRNGAIGRDGTIPWHAPEDLAFFQRETIGGALVMGRNTWESLPVKPLKSRLNLVVSSGRPEGAEHVVATVEAAAEAAGDAGYTRIYGIGGAGVYRAMLPKAHRLLVTEVDLEVAGADTWFPEFDAEAWEPAARIVLRAEEPRCELWEYIRKSD